MTLGPRSTTARDGLVILAGRSSTRCARTWTTPVEGRGGARRRACTSDVGPYFLRADAAGGWPTGCRFPRRDVRPGGGDLALLRTRRTDPRAPTTRLRPSLLVVDERHAAAGSNRVASSRGTVNRERGLTSRVGVCRRADGRDEGLGLGRRAWRGGHQKYTEAQTVGRPEGWMPIAPPPGIATACGNAVDVALAAACCGARRCIR